MSRRCQMIHLIVVMTGIKEIGQHLFKAMLLQTPVILSFCLPETESLGLGR